jgi:lysozyme
VSGNKGRIIGGGVALAIAIATPMVAHFEGKIPHTYADPLAIPTFCFGHTGPDVTPGRVAKPGECEVLLREDVREAIDGVLTCVHVDMTPNEAAAETSFALNIGTTAFCRSTLVKLQNAGAEPYVWCAQMSRWTKGTKAGITIELPGLVDRRAKERAVCEGRTIEFAGVQ